MHVTCALHKLTDEARPLVFQVITSNLLLPVDWSGV